MGEAEEEEGGTKVEETSEKQEQDETPKDVTEEKTVIPVSHVKHSHSIPDEKAIIPLPPPPASETKKESTRGSNDRDAELVRLEQEKKLALIKAWEDSEKTKALNKACKKLSAVDAWENTKKASLEAELRKIEEQLEKKKAEYTEKMKNKVAEIHKLAEEKRAMVEAQKGEELLKAEESAAKYRATGHSPKKFLGCF